MITFFKSMGVGMIVAIPVGTAAILCVRRTLMHGMHHGIAAALGVALTDFIYALIASFWLGSLNLLVSEQHEYFYLGGGIVLILLGARIVLYPAKLIDVQQRADHLKGLGIMRTLGETAALTLSNPLTMVTFLAAFTAFGFDAEHSIAQSGTIAFGVFCGSMLWFTLLSGTVSYLRAKVTPRMFNMVNQLAGWSFILCGTFFVLQAAHEVLGKHPLFS